MCQIYNRKGEKSIAENNGKDRREYQAAYYQAHKGQRKTRTSTAVHRRYNEKTYTVIRVSVRKETAENYKAKCEKLGIPYSQPLHEAIAKLIEEE